jgi:hypothetical protein
MADVTEALNLFAGVALADPKELPAHKTEILDAAKAVAQLTGRGQLGDPKTAATADRAVLSLMTAANAGRWPDVAKHARETLVALGLGDSLKALQNKK